LADKKPDLKPVFHRISDWAKAHQNWNLVDPRELRRDLYDVDPVLLSLALQALVNFGVLRRVYRAVTPSGLLADKDYDDPREVPELVPDRFNHYFPSSEGDIIPVFKPA
jgi:DNA-binding HxlR family transcriptional regulator